MKNLFITLSICFLSAIIASAQNQPNLGFEYNNFTNWKCYSDTSHTIPSSITHATTPATGTNTTYQNLYVNNYLVGPKLHFLETTSGTGVDKYGGYPIVCNLKGAGLHSCKLGSDSAKTSGTGNAKYSSAQGISYNVHIPKNLNKYKVVFYYAINLEDPGSHQCWEMPFFLANAFDSANPNNVIACAQFRVDICTVQSDPQLTGNWSINPKSSPNKLDVHYTPWTPATLIAKNMAGKTLTVQFMSAGCSPKATGGGTTTDSIGKPGAHFGYAYVDFDTTLSAYSDSLKYCPHDTCLSLTPPPGYKGYTVIDSATHQILGLDTSHPVSSVTTLNLCGKNLPKPKSTIQVILTPYAGFGCIDTLTYYVDTFPIHILPPIISPKDSICAGIPMALTDAATGGNWVSDNILKGTIGNTTGIFNGVSNGNDTIMFLDNNRYGCADTSFKVLYVGGLALSAITGKNGVCLKDTIHLSDSIPGGTWSCSNNTLATVNQNGVVSGLQYGTVTITYSLLNAIGCSVSVTKNLQVGMPPLTAITGKNLLCANQSDTLSNATAGGIWISTNPTVASINSSTGILTALTTGTTSIHYVYAFGGCSDSVIYPITVTGASIAPITGNNNVCQNHTIQLNNISPGGTWTSQSTAIATVSNTGLITGNAAGTDTIKYSIPTTSACSDSTYVIITVNPAPSIGSINGPANVCIGKPAVYTDTTANGIWFSTNPAVATIVAGNLTTKSAGNTTLKYIVTNAAGCSDSVALNITINPNPVISAIIGNDTVCISTSPLYNNATPGGVWSTTNNNIAAINAGGNLNPLITGKDTIRYTVTTTNGCIDSVAKQIQVLSPPVAGSIVSAAQSLCVGNTISLSDITAGGVWVSSNPLIATVSNNGVVKGITSGTVNISYSITNFCGTATQSISLTINDVPVVNDIMGNNSLCVGTSTPLADPTVGGVWSSSNPTIVSISPAGVLNGLTIGTSQITYAVTNTCGTTTKILPVTVIDIPVVNNISGVNSVCVAATSQLNETTPGGVWNSSFPTILTVNNSGMIYGVTTGTATVTYAVTNTCGITTVKTNITVNDVPVVSDITGNNTLCARTTIQLNDITPGGIWISNNPAAASVNNNGVITGIAKGNTVISYSVTNVCGITTKTFNINITDVPVVGAIMGNTLVCKGSILQLVDTTNGGTWNSNNLSAATIDVNGVVTGVNLGTSTISYAVTNSCGTTTVSTPVTTIDVPVVNAITGDSTVCANSNILLNDITPGGTWLSTNPAVATVNFAGGVTGISVGNSVISYTVTNHCGSTQQTHPVKVFPVPSSGLVILPSIAEVCIGSPVTLADNSVGEIVVKSIWYLGNNSIDTALTDTYTYPFAGTFWVTHQIIDQDGCLSTPSMVKVTIDPLPSVSTDSIIYVLQNSSVIFNPRIVGIDSGSSVLWTPPINLDNNTILNPVCAPYDTTTYTYTLKVTSSIGCSGYDSTKVIVLQIEPVPNVFSPNGDGNHDSWDVPSLHKFPSVKVDVFDRNGQIVYHHLGHFVAWDGKYQSKDVPMGVYYYIIDRGFKLPLLSGSVTIIR